MNNIVYHVKMCMDIVLGNNEERINILEYSFGSNYNKHSIFECICIFKEKFGIDISRMDIMDGFRFIKKNYGEKRD